VSSGDKASVRPRERPLDAPGEEAVTGTRGEDAPVAGTDLLERGLEPQHLRRARQQVRRHQGAPGLEGRTVDDLGAYLQTHGPTSRAALGAGTDAPQPVRRTAIPKAGGGTRHVGIPTGLDRFIAHALRPVLQEEWDPTGSERSDGVRPPRRAPQAVGQAQADSRDGDTWLVEIDLEKFFDRVNHDGLLRRVRRRVQDRRVVMRIHRFLNAGVLTREGRVEPTAEGTPQGGPRSPRLAHLRRDELDTALEKRGPRVARAATEANIDVRSRQAGARVMARVTRVLERKLRLTVNAAKRAVDRPWNRPFLGFTCTRRQPHRRQVREKALKACQATGRAMTGRTRGRTIRPIGQEWRQLMRGWRAFVGVAEVHAPRRDLDQGIRRRRRSDHWTPWGRRRDRERRTRGGGRPLAWHTVKSAHGPWRLRQRPALASARPQRSFATLGLPSLIRACPVHLIRRTAGDVTRLSGGVGGGRP
jgi:RNA-directed DNA polymerase